MNEENQLREDLIRVQRWALIAGVLATALSILGAFISPVQFFHSYLFAFLFWLGIGLGCIAILMLHHLVGGAWGFVIQRTLETGARSLPLLALLFAPILLGLPYLYEWSREEAAADAVLLHKSAYLNVPFFAVRAILYFALWTGAAYLLNRWSDKMDATGDAGYVRKLESISGPGLVFYGITMTFASVDWVMSLEPHWYSTIFGIVFLVGQGLSTIAFVIIVTMLLGYRKPLADVLVPRHFHDLGNLLLAFVMLWAYVAFSQFLIIWSGNLPEEVTWYAHRLRGGWKWVALALISFHFLVPFLLLLLRRTKRKAQILAGVAVWLLVLRLVDLFWIVSPSLHRNGFGIHWLDFVTPVAVGGLWIAFFAWQLRSRALLPVHDPRINEALGLGEALP